MIEEPGAESFALVHGRVHGVGGCIAHAWIDTGDGRTYDVVFDRYFATVDYMKAAVVEASYTKAQAEELLTKHATCGPWHTLA